MENLKDLIALAAEGNAVEFQERLSNELSDRTVAAIDDLKPEVAAGIFGESYDPDLDLQESMEKMSLGHLAAKHFDHTNNHMYGADLGLSKSSIAKHKQAADSIHSHVTSKYGKSTANAMKKNSEHSSRFDNEGEASSESDKKHHHDFVKNHLGGHGSEEHKKYTSKVYGGESDFDHHANIKEEVEQVNEVSKGLLKRYASKAVDQVRKSRTRIANVDNRTRDGDEHDRKYADDVARQETQKIAKRKKGYDLARAKHNKSGAKVNATEELQQVDEVERPKSPSDKVAMNVAIDIKDHPVATDAQFKAKNEKDKSKPASYHAGDDEVANIMAKTVGIPSKKE